MADETFDVNRYALGIELALNTTAANKSIDSFGAGVEAMERRVTQAAQKAFEGISTSVSGVATNIQEAAQQFAQVWQSARRTVAPSLTLERSTDSMVQSAVELSDLRADSVKDIKAEQKLMGGLVRSAEEQVQFAEGVVKQIRATTEAIKLKNVQHTAQSALMQDQVDLAVAGTDGIREQGEEVTKNVRRTYGLHHAYLMIHRLRRLINHDTERFHTANWREYNTQIMMVEQTTKLSKEYGILRDVALDTYQSLGDLKIPRNEMDRYAKSIALTHRITGVAVQVQAQYVQRLRQTGMTSSDATRQLSWMSQSMQKLGLSTGDMERIMGRGALNARSLMNAFSEGKDAPARFDRLKMAVAGFAKALSATPEEMDSLNQTMATVANDVAKRGIWGAALGRDIRSVDDYKEAVISVGTAIKAETAGMVPGTMEYIATMKTMAQVYGLADDAQAALLMQMADEVKAGTASAKTFQDMSLELDDLGTAATKMGQQYEDATQTLYRHMEQLGAKFAAVWVRVQMIVEQALTPVIAVLSQVVTGLSYVMDWSGWLIDSLDQLGLAMTGVTGLASMATAAAVLLGLTFGGLAGSIMGVVTNLLGLGRVGSMMGGLFTRMGGVVVGVFDMVGRAASALLGGIGRGLGALGAAVAPVILPLMGLSAALFVGAGAAWLMADAATRLAAGGMESVAMLAALSAAVTLVGAGLTMLAYAAMPVIPAILAIGVGMLAVGAASVMLGYASGLLATALRSVVVTLKSLGDGLPATAMAMAAFAVVAVPFGVALLGLGLTAVLASAPLAVLGVALVAVGVGAGTAAAGVVLLNSALGAMVPAMSELATGAVAAGAGLLQLAVSAAPAAAGVAAMAVAAAAAVVPMNLFSWSISSMGEESAAMAAGFGAAATAVAALGAGSGRVADSLQRVLAAAVRVGSGVDSLVTDLGRLAGAAAGAAGPLTSLNLAAAGVGRLAAAVGGLSPAPVVLLGLAMAATAQTASASAASVSELTAGLREAAAAAPQAVASLESAARSLQLVGGATELAFGGLAVSGDRLREIGEASSALEESFGRLARATAELSRVRQAATDLDVSLQRMGAAGSRLGGLRATFDEFSSGLSALTRDITDVVLGRLVQINNGLLEFGRGLDASVAGIDASLTRLGAAGAGLTLMAEAIRSLSSAYDQARVSLRGDGLAQLIGAQTYGAEAQLQSMAAVLNKYAELIESASARVETAVVMRAVPAMQRARDSGIQDVVRAETITTVQVKDKTEGASKENRSADALERIAASLAAVVAAMPQGDLAKGVVDIKGLLELMLAGMSDGGGKGDLASELLNNWS